MTNMKHKIYIQSVLILILLSCTQLSPTYKKHSIVEIGSGIHKVTILELKLSFDLPVDWNAVPQIHRKKGQTMYHFRRDPVKDSFGRRIIPNLAVFIEDIPEGLDIVEYSVNLRMRESYSYLKIVGTKPGQFGELSGVGNIATYTEPVGLHHKVVIFQTVHEGKGVQIVIDGTESVFDDLKDEYDFVLQSLRYVSE